MIKNLKDINLENKRVLIRVDFNVPLSNGIIKNDSRIRAGLETIKYVIDHKGKAIILAHLGRIKTLEDIKKNNLNVVAQRLEELIKKEVKFVNATRGEKVENAINSLNSGEILMLQNVRYEDFDIFKQTEVKLESKNDAMLGKYWASLGDVFVNDAFAVCHRECASISGIAVNIKEKCAGFNLIKEIENANRLLNNISRPYVAVLGGSKVADKIGVINVLLNKADKILVGGAMMFTFLKALGKNIGASKCEEDEYVSVALDMLNRGKDKIVLPIDVKCNTEFKDALGYTKDVDNLSNLDMGLDIGEKTIQLFNNELSEAKTVVWNGPLGVFEMENYCFGTKAMCETLGKLTNNGATTIVGGGETVSAIEQFGYENNISHISTGGGAFLELLENNTLPGIEILNI